MSFSGDVARFTMRFEAKTKEIFVGVVNETTRSIVEGSEITGSPGQPVDTGALRASFQTILESEWSAIIATKIKYAEAIEDGVGAYGPLTLRSQVGGFHSGKLTVAGFPRIVAAVAR
jgi:hypothetical protein